MQVARHVRRARCDRFRELTCALPPHLGEHGKSGAQVRRAILLRGGRSVSANALRHCWPLRNSRAPGSIGSRASLRQSHPFRNRPRAAQRAAPGTCPSKSCDSAPCSARPRLPRQHGSTQRQRACATHISAAVMPTSHSPARSAMYISTNVPVAMYVRFRPSMRLKISRLQARMCVRQASASRQPPPRNLRRTYSPYRTQL